MKMMALRFAPVLLIVSVVMALPGGAAPGTGDDAERLGKVVARVGSTNITVGDLEARLKRHMRPGMFEDEEKLKDLLGALLDRELLVQEARRRKLDENKRVVNHLKRILYNQIQTKYVAEKMPLDSITDEEIKAYYDEHFDEYNQPTLVRAYQILLKDKAEAESVLEQVKLESMDLRQFKVLAGERSEDLVTKKRGGDLRYFNLEGKVWTSEESVPTPVAEEAFSVEILVRASVIVTDEQEQAKVAMDKAMMPGLTDAAFAKLVAKFKAQGGAAAESGDLGYFNLEGMVDGAPEGSQPVIWDITRAAFSMRDPGKTYPKVIKIDDKFHIIRVTGRKDPGKLVPQLVETDKGFHVVWVVNRRPAVHKTVEDMEPAIRQRIWQEKKKEFLDKLIVDLKKKYEVEIDEQLLSEVAIDLSDAKPASKNPAIPPTPAAHSKPNPPPVPAN
ncbi:MAG: peptidyl-prolyl cis-trans isomerase [Deltaproteobacteria bacterium]|nr:peptidyl-prolyl cis-trans isomerase [Deltaproteobacteria bacterium]